MVFVVGGAREATVGRAGPVCRFRWARVSRGSALGWSASGGNGVHLAIITCRRLKVDEICSGLSEKCWQCDPDNLAKLIAFNAYSLAQTQ